MKTSVYLNITNKCSNNCYFCVRNFKYGLENFNLTLKEEPQVSQVIKELSQVLNRRSWKEVVFCGFGEPLERLDCVIEVSKWIKKNHLIPIRIDTNGHGYLLNKGRNVVEELKTAGVDKVSVSLNAHDKETYDKVCHPRFKDAFHNILDFIEKAKDKMNTEITVVSVPEVDLEKVKKIAMKIGTPFRVREYYSPFW